MNIYLIRHGRQSSSACNVDVPLADAGRRQAERLGKRLSRYPLDALYSSHLIRAVETAKIACADRKELIDTLQIRSGIAEMGFGELTGKPDPEVKRFYKDYYKEQYRLFQEGRMAVGSALDEVNELIGEFFVPPEEMWYPGGENGAMVLQRAIPVIREWIDSGKEHIAVVTHGGFIRVLLCAIFGGDFAKRLMFGTSLENCSITQIHYDPELHGFFLDRFNDYAHLEGEAELMRGIWKG